MSCFAHIACFRGVFSILLLVALSVHARFQKQGWTDVNQSVHTRSQKQEWTDVNQNEITINALIHGTMSLKHFFNLGNLIRMMRDDVENSVYHKSLDIVREDKLCFINQAMQGYGLQAVDMETICADNASGALARLLTLTTNSVSPKQTKSLQTFYTFGWPGVISQTLRLKAGKQLYNELSDLVAQLSQQYQSVRIRIYGFSHGGNVALNIAQYDDSSPKFTIDELILLGTPIQSESDYLINDPIFAHVFNIFSPADRIQTLDCFSLNRFFSSKRFKSRTDFHLPNKLTQIELRLTEPAQRHKRDVLFDKSETLVARKKNNLYLRDRSPGHSELWFFGWTPQYYRQNFPLNPLPMIVLLPIILSSPQLTQLNPEQYWVVDVRPSFEYCLVRLQKDRTLHPPIPLKAKLLAELKQHAELFRPKKLSQKQYDDMTYAAIKLASQELDQKPQVTASSD